MSTVPVNPILETLNLSKAFRLDGGLGAPKRTVHALTDVSIAVAAGETVAVVGESGCGKSTLARCVSGLSEQTSGDIVVDGTSAKTLLQSDPMRYRRTVQMVFQDPYSSVNPRRRIVDAVGDALRLHKLAARRDRREAVAELLARVGLSGDHLDRYPHELSGGQRQRVAIARALAVRPAVIVCDEPVSALDVSVQAQVMNLFADVQAERGIGYLFISHNLALIQHIADRIAVMYLGQVVEIGSREAMKRRLGHPYSRILFAAAPKIGRPRGDRPDIGSIEAANPLDGGNHCRFHNRCPHVQPRCLSEMPALRIVDERMVRCHRAEDLLGD